MKPIILGLTAALGITGASVAMGTVGETDTDGDGLINLAEMQTAYPTVSEEVFASADANGDALVDEAELAAAREAGLIRTE